MKQSDKLFETQMDEDQAGHIETVARRNGIQFLDRTLAMMTAFRAGNEELLSNAASFAVMGLDRDTGERQKALYLDAHDGKNALEAYYIALHELGHLILDHHYNGKDSVDNEIEAWEWTLSHAQHEPDDDIYEMMMNCLATYTDCEEAEKRPYSLLALTTPHAWRNNGWSRKEFRENTEKATGDTVTVGQLPNGIVVPLRYAQMVNSYIADCRNHEEEILKLNVKDAYEELKESLGRKPGGKELLKRVDESFDLIDKMAA